VHLFGKFWIAVALIPFWAAVIAVLLERLHGDSKLERLAPLRGNKAQGEEQKARSACLRMMPVNRQDIQAQRPRRRREK